MRLRATLTIQALVRTIVVHPAPVLVRSAPIGAFAHPGAETAVQVPGVRVGGENAEAVAEQSGNLAVVRIRPRFHNEVLKLDGFEVCSLKL